MPASDAQLIASARRGDKQAYAEIICRYSRRIYNLAYRFSGRHADAEDITQEVFIKVHRRLKQFQPDRPFQPWLYRIAVNTAVSYLRRRPRHQQLKKEKTDSAATPAERALQSELQARLQAAITRLPLKYRQVVILRYAEEMSLGEIGVILKLPENTVKTRWRRAKLLLRAELRDLFETK